MDADDPVVLRDSAQKLDAILRGAVQRHERQQKYRTFGIWSFGLIGGAVFFGFLGDHVAPEGHGAFWGALFGLCLFACMRLWLAKP